MNDKQFQQINNLNIQNDHIRHSRHIKKQSDWQ